MNEELSMENGFSHTLEEYREDFTRNAIETVTCQEKPAQLKQRGYDGWFRFFVAVSVGAVDVGLTIS